MLKTKYILINKNILLLGLNLIYHEYPFYSINKLCINGIIINGVCLLFTIYSIKIQYISIINITMLIHCICIHVFIT